MQNKFKYIIFTTSITILTACNHNLYYGPKVNYLTSGFPLPDSISFKYPQGTNDSEYFQYIKGDLIKTLISKEFGNQSRNNVNAIIYYIIHTKGKVVKVDTSLSQFKFDFLKYMPVSYPEIKRPSLYIVKLKFTHIGYRIDTTRNKFIKLPGQFEYKSEYFPNKFIYPKDVVIHYNIYGSTSKNIPDQIYYLILNLPYSLKLNVHLSKHTLQAIQSFYGYYKDSYHNNIGLIRSVNEFLLLNPGYTEAYKPSIKLFWKLYLFNIKYNILKDTCNCYERLKQNRNKNSYCPLNLQSQNVQTYLEKAIDKDPEMYKSYFELIFWQMYQPKDFKVKDNNGEKRSFTFTSTSERFPGKYKVKFNIYRPYKFKVVRQ